MRRVLLAVDPPTVVVLRPRDDLQECRVTDLELRELDDAWIEVRLPLAAAWDLGEVREVITVHERDAPVRRAGGGHGRKVDDERLVLPVTGGAGVHHDAASDARPGARAVQLLDRDGARRRDARHLDLLELAGRVRAVLGSGGV